MAGLREHIESSGVALAKIVASASPLVASALGSPLSGIVISLLANLFGANPKDTDDLISKINKDPDATLKLKKLEIDHSDTLAQIAAQEYETEVDDRKDARANAGLYKDFLRHMAYIVTLGFFIALGLLFVPPINPPQAERELLSMLIGVLVSKWATIIDFFYGSARKQANNKEV